MKPIKSIIVLLLIIVFCLQISGEERKKPISMKELTDPKSPSYVPYPYPKKRAEIIADFKYYCQNFCGEKNGSKESFISDYEDITDKISLNLLEPNSNYQIGEIFKVKNRRAGFADDYTWLIMVMNRNGQIAMRVALYASGLLIGAGAIGEQDIASASPEERQRFARLMKVITDEDVKNILSQSIGRTVNGNEIKKMERVAYPSSIGSYLCPVQETKMADGAIYYYSELRDMIYSIDKKIPWKKNNQGIRPLESSLTPSWDYLPDTINDELVILTRIPRK
ncbi:MAG: hypothetical protein NT166_11910 [Candidatus Aminicenantes bacterium]|nr:hypothetical protein [Candidatus Aminicenantes bacterium]